MILREYKAYFWLLLLALLTAWLAKVTNYAIYKSTESVEHSADYFSNDYSKMEMDTAGQPKSHLRAAKMQHFSDTNVTELTQPLMTFFNSDEPPWEVRSEIALISADGKDVLMQGKALVERAAAPGVRMLKVNSSNLKVKPEESYAETTEWAELISPPNTTTGIGMKVTFRKPVHLQLLANVKGRYEVNN